MAVTLVPVSDSNEQEVVAVDITEEQWTYLSTQSLAEFLLGRPDHPTFGSYAIVSQGTVVGFVCFGYEPETPTSWWVPLLIIDRRYQGQGRGRAALEEVVNLARFADPRVLEIGLSYRPENAVAATLYRSLGFTPADNVRDKVRAWLNLDSAV